MQVQAGKKYRLVGGRYDEVVEVFKDRDGELVFHTADETPGRDGPWYVDNDDGKVWNVYSLGQLHELPE